MKTIEMIPDKKVVWLVEENYFKNAKDQSEWIGNKIVFEISKQGNKTQLVFTQIGLVPPMIVTSHVNGHGQDLLTRVYKV